MDLDRRKFLQVCGLTASSMLVPSGITQAAPLQASTIQPIGMLSDLTKCIGCGWCTKACSDWNHLASRQPGSQGQSCLSAQTWTLPDLREIEHNGQRHQVFVKQQCMHCLNPACVSACPVGALQKLENGPVVYDCTRCIGCRYCMVACPFGIPKFEWDEPLPRIQKCTFCVDRQVQGMAPACASACPTGALTFGSRETLIAEAQARIQADPDRYHPHVYGKDELGGTSWMYLSPVPFEELDFPIFKREPVTALSESVATYGTAGVAASVTLLLGGLYYWFHRQQGDILVEEPTVEENKHRENALDATEGKS